MKQLLTTLVLFFTAMAGKTQNCPPPTAQLDLDINNVRVRILNSSDLWRDPVTCLIGYEVPINSGKHVFNGGSLWIGGIDAGNQLLVAAQTYRQTGNDFWPGPISKSPGTGMLSVSNARCNDFDNLFPITRSEVVTFASGGNVTASIMNWPGNGNVSNNELPYLAPFFDANNDGQYNYSNGDYPYFNLSGTYTIDPFTGEAICDDYLFGDKVIWWVFNDIGNIKTETNSGPIGLEIRAFAFAYSMPGSVLDNTTLYKYQIINRSSAGLFQVHAGIWADAELGNAGDDYVGCDVTRSLGYVYNGDADDDGTAGYGLLPPAAGVDFLKGPLADINDNTDNDHDGVIDEPGEKCLMSSFIYYENTNGTPNGNPGITKDYYTYLSGNFWLDSLPVTYGGDARGNGNGATSTPTSYMFPDNTNPLFSTPWTMSSGGILPNDMRFLISAGPFTMQPGEVNYITDAVLWARTSSSGSAMPSVPELQTASDMIQSFFDNCFSVTAIENNNPMNVIGISPNPFINSFTISFKNTGIRNAEIKIFSADGKLESSLKYSGQPNDISTGDDLKTGVHIIHIRSGKNQITKRVVKY